MTALASLAVLAGAAVLAVRAESITSFPRLVLAVGAPYVAVVALLGAVLAVRSRRVVLSIVAASLALASVAIQVQWYYLGPPGDVGRNVEIRVLSSNLYKPASVRPSRTPNSSR